MTPLPLLMVDPAFSPTVAAQVQKIRGDIRAQRQVGKLVIYASTPISPRGGGNEKVNLEIAAVVKTRLEKRFGAGVWVLDPGAYQMAAVGGRPPGGEEYMLVWTQSSRATTAPGATSTWRTSRARGTCARSSAAARTTRRGASSAGPRRTGGRERGVPPRGRGRRRPAGRVRPLLHAPRQQRVQQGRPRRVEHLREDQPAARARRAGAMFFDGRPASPAEMETEISPGYEFR